MGMRFSMAAVAVAVLAALAVGCGSDDDDDAAGSTGSEAGEAAATSAIPKLAEHPEKGSFCGPEVPQIASYSWTLTDGVLTLKAKDDPCADRDSTLSGEWRAR
jgi:hypothetical protein